MNTPSMIELHEKPPRTGFALFFALPIFAWALYDAANTIFSSNIVTIFFPFYMTEVVGGNEELNQLASTFISYTNAVASFFLVLFSPLFGVWMDRTGKKMVYLLPFTLITIISTFLMGVAALYRLPGSLFGLPLSVALVLLFFMIAKFFYNSSLVFYDTTISDLGNPKEIPLISGWGVAIGYVGTLIGLLVYPLAKDHSALAFIPSALLFLLLSLPFFLSYKDKPSEEKKDAKIPWVKGYREILTTFREMRNYRGIFTFMLAYFFFNDAIATAIAMMAVYAKAVVHFSSSQFIFLYLVSTISSIVGSFLFGFIARKTGAKMAVVSVAVLLVVALAMATFAVSKAMFWVAGSLYGVAMGSMWVTSRTLIVELSPPEKRGEFFGLFAFSGKLSAIVGPALYGTVTLLLKDLGNVASRTALGSLMVMVFIGLVVMFFVKTNSSKAERHSTSV
ncbi:YxiO [[Clostridium] ultunense Esp]|nr:YxiO [[Clostridium] ultunense Esp]